MSFAENCSNHVVIYWGGTFTYALQNSLVLSQILLERLVNLRHCCLASYQGSLAVLYPVSATRGESGNCYCTRRNSYRYRGITTCHFSRCYG